MGLDFSKENSNLKRAGRGGGGGGGGGGGISGY